MRTMDPFNQKNKPINLGLFSANISASSKKSQGRMPQTSLREIKEDFVALDYFHNKSERLVHQQSQNDQMEELGPTEILVGFEKPRNPKITCDAWLMSGQKSCFGCSSKGRKVNLKLQESIFSIGNFTKKKDTMFYGVDFEYIRMGVEANNGFLKVFPLEPTSFSFTFLMPSSETAQLWKESIKKAIQEGRKPPSGRRLKEGASLREAQVFFKSLCMPQSWLMDRAESGDIILFQSNDKGAKLQRVFTQSQYGIQNQPNA